MSTELNCCGWQKKLLSQNNSRRPTGSERLQGQERIAIEKMRRGFPIQRSYIGLPRKLRPTSNGMLLSKTYLAWPLVSEEIVFFFSAKHSVPV